jgi:FKBP-type peptidyl-prolyl cis-trans isomerase
VGSEDVVKGKCRSTATAIFLSSLLGFSIGVLGMREGGERRILVPSTLGYGEAGNRELNVPPGANLAIGWFAKGFVLHTTCF